MNSVKDIKTHWLCEQCVWDILILWTVSLCLRCWDWTAWEISWDCKQYVRNIVTKCEQCVRELETVWTVCSDVRLHEQCVTVRDLETGCTVCNSYEMCEQCVRDLETVWTVRLRSWDCDNCVQYFETMWAMFNSSWDHGNWKSSWDQRTLIETMWTVCASFFNLILCEQCAPAFSTWYYANSVCQLSSEDLGHIAPDNFPQDKILHGGIVSGSSSVCTQKWTCSCLTGWEHCRSYILHV